MCLSKTKRDKVGVGERRWTRITRKEEPEPEELERGGEGRGGGKKVEKKKNHNNWKKNLNISKMVVRRLIRIGVKGGK